MKDFNPPSEETSRLAALHGYGILDTPPEVIFDEYARMAASICETPMAMVSLIDRDRQWLKARHGIDAVETPRELTFCTHAIQGVEPMVVEDARLDQRFAQNPFVATDRGIRFYAGAPLVTNEGMALGTLCVVDMRPRQLPPERLEALRLLSRQVVAQLELRRRLFELSTAHVRRTREMHTMLDDQKNRIEQLSNYSSQTGLANREHFIKRIDEQLASRGKSNRMATVFVVELQSFDNLSEGLGANGIDELLKEAGRRVGGSAEQSFDVAHLREERFGLLRTDLHGAMAAAMFAETTLMPALNRDFRIGDRDVRPTFKVGIAITPADGVDGLTVLRAAKTALITARSSSESIAFSSAEIATRVAGALTLEAKLRRAIDRDEFILHYQPKVDLQTGQITGVEALLRWADPDAKVRGTDDNLRLVPPGRFIPLLEETGLIVPVGALVLAKAADDYREWIRQGIRAPRIAVNVSTLQLTHRDFMRVVSKVIGAGAPAMLDIEITEGTFLDQTEESISRLRSLRDMGMRIAIDDFGTGYSSLRYLTELPIDVLKIDRSFVMNLEEGSKEIAVVSSIIELARGLGFKTVAEGVETREQERLLRALKCNEMQGYLFSKPLPKADFELLLTQTGFAVGCAQ